MGLYRANDRLTEDWRILCIEDPEEFVLFRERHKLDIQGMLYRYPLTEQMIEDAEAFNKKVKEKVVNETGYAVCSKLTYMGLASQICTTSFLQNRWESSLGKWKESQDRLEEPCHSKREIEVSKTLQAIALDLASYWEKARPNNRPFTKASLRSDSYWPQPYFLKNPHKHGGGTITMSVIGDGSAGVNEERKMYTLPAGEVFLFDEIEHYAPLAQEGTPLHDLAPRVNFVYDCWR